jgi:DNA-binding HxlR family transcriptional regulator
MLTKEELLACPVATIVELIGNKWKLLIIRNLLGGTQRFNEIRRTIPGISQKVLTDNLRALEKDEIIHREVFPEVPPRVEYSLTELGLSLQTVFDSMIAWGEEYQALVRKQQ